MNYVKPQKPLIQDGKGIYPLTTIDQVVRADGRRFSENEFNRVFQRNLLRPTLQTTTTNGVTCTNNGDGTFTLNGTASTETIFTLGSYSLSKGTYKLLALNISTAIAELYVEFRQDDGTQIIVNSPSGYVYNSNGQSGFLSRIIVGAGYTCNNLVVKPMITEDLNATYDDFVSYDDSFVKKNELDSKVSELNTTIANGTLKTDLLWENASPMSEFAAQTISLDLSEYSIIGVVFLYEVPSNTNHSVLLTALVDGSTTLFQMGAQSDANNIRRFGTVSTTGIVWGSGGFSGTGDNKYARPIKIYGIK